MRLDSEVLDKRQAYFLMTSLIVPRPIAWVGTRSVAGVDNLAPFSYFSGVSSEPPIVSISVARGRGGALKDTAQNILTRGELSISIGSLSQMEALHNSSFALPPEESEFDVFGIGASECVSIDAPRPAEAGVTMECRLHDAIDLGNTHLILARVVAFEIDEALMRDGRVLPEILNPIARLGGEYAELGRLHKLGRPRR